MFWCFESRLDRERKKEKEIERTREGECYGVLDIGYVKRRMYSFSCVGADGDGQ